MLLVATPALAAPGGPGRAFAHNAQFTHFQEEQDVIHILVFSDDGRPGQPPAVVQAGEPILMGFEWSGDSIQQLEDVFLDNPTHDITVSVDGGPPVSLKHLYQTPFNAATRSGPAFTWDHDGDGPGDGDGDGIDDWSGPVMFFRYEHPGFTAGTHTFEFVTTSATGTVVTELITVVVGS